MTAASLAAAWAAVATSVASLAQMPPKLDENVWQDVANGKVARRTIQGDPATIVGVGVLAVSRESAWLSLTDDRLSAEIDSLFEVALEGRWASPKLLYQRLDLPWPLLDRHWVIQLSNNAALAAASGVWERSWDLRPDALSAARAHTDGAAFDAAETVSVNQGSWLLLALDESHTLGVYQARATLGGSIPDGAVDTYTRSSISGLYAGVQRNVENVRTRYAEGCTPQPGADGVAIPCYR